MSARISRSLALRRRAAGVQEHLGCLRVVQDGLERLVELVRDGCGDLANRGTSIEVRDGQLAASGGFEQLPAVHFSAPAAALLEQEPREERRLKDGYSRNGHDLGTVVPPEARLPKLQCAPGGQPAFIDVPALKLAGIEDERGIPLRRDGCLRRRFAIEDDQRTLAEQAPGDLDVSEQTAGYTAPELVALQREQRPVRRGGDSSHARIGWNDRPTTSTWLLKRKSTVCSGMLATR